MINSERVLELNKKIERIVVNIKGYISDSKTFGFEPTSLAGMQAKKQKLEEELNQLEGSFKFSKNE